MLARKSLLLFIVSMTNSFLGFLSTIVIARWMGAAALGTIGYLLGLLGLLAICLDMGFSLAHLKRVSEDREEPAPLIGAFLLLKVILVLVFLTVAILLPVIQDHLFHHALFQDSVERWAYYIIAATYILHSLASVFLFTFEARLETAKESLATFAGSLVSFGAKAAVALFGLGVVALSAGYLIEPLVLLAVALFFFRGYHIARPRREHLASYIRYTLPVTLNTAITIIITNVNPVLIKSLWTATEVGYYTSVLGFAAVLDRVALTVAALFFPQASSDAVRGNLEEIQRRVFIIERYVLTIVVPFAVLLAFFSHEIVTITLGAAFAPAVPILMLMATKSVVAAVFQPYSTVLYAIEKQGYLVISNVLGLATLLAMDMLLVPGRLGNFPLAGLGGGGAAIALVAMAMVSGIVQAKAVRQHTNIGLYWKALLYLVAGGAMYLLMLGSKRVVNLPARLELPFLTVVGLGGYFAILIILGLFTRADAQVYLNVLHPSKMLEYISAELDKRS